MWLPKWFGSLIGDLYGPLVGLRWRTLVRSRIRQTEMNEKFAEDLWLRKRSSGYLIGDRSFRMLEWKLTNQPDKDIAFFCLEDSDGSAVGYVAYVVSPDNKVNVVDFCCAPRQSAASLLAPFLQQMKGRKLISVALEMDSARQHDIRTLRSIGFFRREASDVYVTYCDEKVAANIHDRLWISRYDGDS
jgi:hypothetical protein